MSRKNMPLIVGGAVFGVLALGLGSGTFKTVSAYSENEEALAQQRSKLVRLQNRDPYPSDENAEVLTHQREHFRDYLLSLQAELRKDQDRIADVSRDRWQGEFGQTLREIVQNARARGVNLPTGASGFLFGFERYRESIPMDSELGRLFPQLQGIAQLCRTLFAAGITELVSIEREQFELVPLSAVVDESESPRARRRRQAQAEEPAPAAGSREPFKDKDGLFTREHYAVTFRAGDAALWNVLSQFARQVQPFVVVTKLDILNAARPAVQPPKAAEPEAAPAPRAPVAMDGFRAIGAPAPAPAKEEGEPLPRELRVVAGNDLSLVRIELDIYRFAEEAPAPAAEEEAP